jgi:hypothetical protein
MDGFRQQISIHNCQNLTKNIFQFINLKKTDGWLFLTRQTQTRNRQKLEFFKLDII